MNAKILRQILLKLCFCLPLGTFFPICANAQSRFDASDHSAAKPQTRPRKVLIIYSYRDNIPYQKRVRNALLTRLEELPSAQRPQLFEERLEIFRITPIKRDSKLLALIVEKYRHLKFDLIVTDNDYAFEFLNRTPDAFPNVKRIHITLTRRPFHRNVVSVEVDPKTNLELILRLFPKTKKIVVLTSRDTVINGLNARAFEKFIQPFQARNVIIEILKEFTFPELYRRVSSLVKETVVFHTPIHVDRLGIRKIPRDVLVQLVKVAPVPIFVNFDPLMGTGVIGGYVVHAAKIGILIADAVIGIPLPTIKRQIATATTSFYFDDNALKRWGVPDKNLPDDRIIVNRKISDWVKYRIEISIIVVALILETLLIISLLHNLKLRKKSSLALAKERDFLDQRVSERTYELEISRNLADTANRAKSEFIANMSHEIRTPMNAIIGFTDVLKELEDDPKKSNYLHIIQTSSNSLLTLINDILDLSKIEAGQMQLHRSAFSIYDLVDELQQIFSQNIADKNLIFECLIEDDVPQRIIFDESRLRQVLANLIANAIKFTHQGSVKLALSCQHPQTSTNANTLTLCISISDSGIGIPKDQQQKIFTSFSQVKGQNEKLYGGTGLGLTITKKIIDLAAGTISLDSTEGVGTTFCLHIPAIEIAKDPDVPQHENISHAASHQFAPATILIVDDVDYNRDTLAAYLGEGSFEIRFAENGQEAIASVNELKPDLILLDMKMPVMDGYEAAKILKSSEQTRTIPIVAVTAFALNHDEAKIRTLCDGYLRKPVSKQELTQTLTQFLSH